MFKKQNNWFPAVREEQSAMFINISNKIGRYKETLNLTNGQIERIQIVCKTFVAVNNFVDQSHTTARTVSDWQNLILTGTPKGAIPPAAPNFRNFTMPEGAFIGILEEFHDLIEFIKSARNFTDEIGADLMILERKIKGSDENSVFPSLRIHTLFGCKVYIESNLQGMQAMRIEYRHKNTEKWQTVAFLTQLPAEFDIKPNPGDPRAGQLRAILMKNNNDVGQFSLNYPVTLT